ncbi:MAG: ABC transporter permease [Actinobacteria bacterium]|nr:ABC transporter permease [Actinomycetota bacterium]
MSRGKINFGFDRFSGLYVWALFIIVFGALRPDQFLSMDNVHLIASQQAIAAMLGLAILMPLACGAFDLSIGANVNLAAVLVTILQVRDGVPMVPAILITVAVGALIGIINGFIIVKLHVSSFIATLGMASIITAAQTIVTNNLEPTPVLSTTWTGLTQNTIFGFQAIFLYLLVLAVILWWVLEHMPIGRYIYAVGSNTEAARLSGLRVGKYTWISLIVSGAITSLAGVAYASLSGPSLTFGQALLLPAYAAAFLGSTQLKPGRFNVWGTVIAVYVLATGVQGIQYITSVQWLNDVFNGCALILAVSFAVWRQRAKVERGTIEEDSGGDSPISHAPGLGDGKHPDGAPSVGGTAVGAIRHEPSPDAG